MPRCPGQDQRYWTADDIFDVCCPYCDHEIEFWKDEPFRLCRACMKEVRNPRIDLGCAKWCKFSEQCLGSSADEQLAAAPVIAKLKAQLKGLTESEPARYEAAMEIYRIANLLVTSEGGDPCHIKTGALLVGVIRETPAPLELAHALLADTILDEEETTVIIDLLRGLLAGERPVGIDGAVINDAIILAREELTDEAHQQTLITEGANMIHALRLKKKEESQ
jgi:hypothetical protein